MLLMDIYQKEKLVDSQKLFHFCFVEVMKALARGRLFKLGVYLDLSAYLNFSQQTAFLPNFFSKFFKKTLSLFVKLASI